MVKFLLCIISTLLVCACSARPLVQDHIQEGAARALLGDKRDKDKGDKGDKDKDKDKGDKGDKDKDKGDKGDNNKEDNADKEEKQNGSKYAVEKYAGYGDKWSKRYHDKWLEFHEKFAKVAGKDAAKSSAHSYSGGDKQAVKYMQKRLSYQHKYKLALKKAEEGMKTHPEKYPEALDAKQKMEKEAKKKEDKKEKEKQEKEKQATLGVPDEGGPTGVVEDMTPADASMTAAYTGAAQIGYPSAVAGDNLAYTG